jgi:hypothetical protein
MSVLTLMNEPTVKTNLVSPERRCRAWVNDKHGGHQCINVANGDWCWLYIASESHRTETPPEKYEADWINWRHNR